MKKIKIYTDGACSGNPGPGGWGAIIISKFKRIKISGSNPNTTNNAMELTAVIEALKIINFECEVTVYSDSAYVVNAYSDQWIESWKRNGWRTSKNKPVKNKELWLELDRLVNIHNVKFIKVKGHSDNVFNNKCDKLAVSAYQKYKK